MLTDNLILDRGGEKLFSVTKLWGEPNKYKSYITHTKLFLIKTPLDIISI